MARNAAGISHRAFKQRLQDIGDKVPYRAAAENVEANAGYDDPARAAVEGWKESPEHRRNMLGDFSLTGTVLHEASRAAIFSPTFLSNRSNSAAAINLTSSPPFSRAQ